MSPLQQQVPPCSPSAGTPWTKLLDLQPTLPCAAAVPDEQQLVQGLPFAWLASQP